ncbi:hypothetical protein JCM11251_006772 [Rhodosporidiobolus azoricus]
MAADEPLLPTKSPTPSSQGFEPASAATDSTNTGWELRLARRWQDRKTRRQALWVVGSIVTFWLVLQLLGGSALARQKRAARSAQRLEGFSPSRLESVPEALRVPWDVPVADLLGHPLLTAHTTPSCRLNTFQQDRYAPLLPSYRGRRPRLRQPQDLPRSSLNYFIAINLYDSASVLPSLIRALHSLLTSLGPHRFHLSIYENGSKDDTPFQLFLLAKLLKQLGAGYTIVSDPDQRAGWTEGKRIEGLAGVRNRVMRPLYDAPSGTWDRVLFLNDVHLCEAELLEVLLQHEVQDADMSCGMDYKELRIPEFEEQGYPLLFYDVWVARDMLGLPFYEIKYPKGDWVLPSRVMPHSPSRFRFDSLLPTQVYSCFNGVTVLSSSLFHAPHSLRFRSDEGTDAHSECYLLARDIWKALSPLSLDGADVKKGGKGARGARIQVVPRASVGYRVEEYEQARKDRNTTAFELDGAERKKVNEMEMVEWDPWPPKLVTTYPFGHWHNQISIPPF